MFINFTNHQSDKWSGSQIAATKHYGEIYDIQFPEIDPNGNEQYIDKLSEQYVSQIMSLNPNAVLCQGEMSLAFAVVQKLSVHGITVVAACSKRKVIEVVTADGKTEKTSQFEFTRFRKYLLENPTQS